MARAAGMKTTGSEARTPRTLGSKLDMCDAHLASCVPQQNDHVGAV